VIINRRHIRTKVMQSIYSFHRSSRQNIEKEEKFLFKSIEDSANLYLTILSALIEIQKYESDFIERSKKKYLPSPEELNPNTKFIDNRVLHILSQSNSIAQALEDKKINNWKKNNDCIVLLVNDIKTSQMYQKYLSSPEDSFEEDRSFMVDLFTKIIAPNHKLYQYLEDYSLTWIDDVPLVNTNIQKQLKNLKSETDIFEVPSLYKDEEDKKFAQQIFRKTILNETILEKEYINKTPNWDKERIAEIDTIILKMAICEFLKFPSIPFKATINEYLEIAKEYSTPKSSIFINGVLDKLVQEYKQENRTLKSGRGLKEN